MRRRGWAVSSRETSHDQLTVAVPVFDDEGRIYLALGMRLDWSPAEEARIDDGAGAARGGAGAVDRGPGVARRRRRRPAGLSLRPGPGRAFSP